MSRTVEEIKEEITNIEDRRFSCEMADRINWTLYNKLTDRINELKRELKEVENG